MGRIIKKCTESIRLKWSDVFLCLKGCVPSKWIRFFLEAVSKAASDSLESISKLSGLHDKNIEKLPKTSRSKDNLRAVFDYIEQYPIMDIKRTAKKLEISYNTAAMAVKKLVELGILQETTNTARNRVFAYEEYLGILRKDT